MQLRLWQDGPKRHKAQASAWLFVLVILVFTVIQFRTADRWVYYAGERGR